MSNNFTAKKTPPPPRNQNVPPPPVVPSPTYPSNQVLYNPYGQQLPSPSSPPQQQPQQHNQFNPGVYGQTYQQPQYQQPQQYSQPPQQYQPPQYGQPPQQYGQQPQQYGQQPQQYSQQPQYQPTQYGQQPPTQFQSQPSTPPPTQPNNQTYQPPYQPSSPQLQKSVQYNQPQPQLPNKSSPQLGQYNQPSTPPPPPQQQLNQSSPQLGQYNQPSTPPPPNNQTYQPPYQPSSPQLQKDVQYNQPPQQTNNQTLPQLQKAGEYNLPPPQQQMAGQYYQPPAPQQSYGVYNQQQQQPQYQPPPQQYSQMAYPPPPPQQTVFLAPTQSQGALGSINIMAPPATVVGNKLFPPPGATFYMNGTGIKSRLKVRIISGQNLVSMDANGFSDPYIKLKSASIESFQATKVIDKNLNPYWNEELFVEIQDPEKEVLMFDVYDRDAVGCDDLMGCVGIDLSKLPMGMEVVSIENLHYTKHGTIQIGLTAIDFGLTNISPNYHLEYCKWRSELVGMNKKDFKKIKKEGKNKITEEGPYTNGKITHPDFKFVHGYIKRRKTKREVAGEVGKGALKVVGYTLLLPVIALTSS